MRHELCAALCLLTIDLAACGASRPPPPVEPLAPAPIDLAAHVATIEIARAPRSEQLDHCRFWLRDALFWGWSCGADLEVRPIALLASIVERLDAALSRVDDWGARTDAEGKNVVVLSSGQDVVRVTVAGGSLAALRDEAFTAAAAALVVWRERGEDCAECRDDAYCEERYACASTGPDSKDCAVRPHCLPRHASAGACEHHYECISRHCDGASDRIGHCR